MDLKDYIIELYDLEESKIKVFAFVGTKEDLESYIKKLTDPETDNDLRLVSYREKGETLVEFRRLFLTPDEPTEEIKVTDIFNGVTRVLKSSEAIRLIKEDGYKFLSSVKEDPRRIYIDKKLFNEIINDIKP